MGPGGKIAPEFLQLNKLAIATGDRLPGTTADFQNMMTMLRRQGMSAQVIWAGWVSRRRISACSCRWHRRMPQSLPRNCRTPRRPPKRHDEPDGPYPAGYYAGVDPGNMLQGFANISSAMDIIKKKGPDAAKTFSPLLVMADQAGMAGESAGNAYRKIFRPRWMPKILRA